MLSGREFVTVEDLLDVAADVLRHRLWVAPAEVRDRLRALAAAARGGADAVGAPRRRWPIQAFRIASLVVPSALAWELASTSLHRTSLDEALAHALGAALAGDGPGARRARRRRASPSVAGCRGSLVGRRRRRAHRVGQRDGVDGRLGGGRSRCGSAGRACRSSACSGCARSTSWRSGRSCGPVAPTRGGAPRCRVASCRAASSRGRP